MIDFQGVLTSINETASNEKDKGKIADYIPELAKVDVDNFGIHLIDIQQNIFQRENLMKNFRFKVSRRF